MERARASAGAGERAGRRLAERPMGAAFERALAAPGFGEHRARQRDVLVLAGMRGAGERDLFLA